MVHSLVGREQRRSAWRLRMRQSSRIESLNYGVIYVLGCLVAGLMSWGRGTPLERLIGHTLASWGYVIYYVLNTR
jgi:hypothetical protein